MKKTLNLVEQPWIPCLQADESYMDLSLRDALARAHQLQGVHGDSPLVTAALHRLLLALLHRIFGPAGYDEWAHLWQAGRWDTGPLDDYFGHWGHRFDLFHPHHPFYQAADERVKPKSVGSLVHDVASGNNATLFDHHTDDEGITLTAAEAARMLLAAQTFGLGGLSGLPDDKFTDAPCARGIVFLVRGKTLFETLALNLLPYPDETIMPYTADDCPAWELENPYLPRRTIPRGYLDYLTWQNRRVLLIPESNANGGLVREMTVAPGLRLDSGVLDPMAHYRRDEKRGPLPLPFVEERALWRDSAALFRLHDQGFRPPRTFGWLSELVLAGYLDLAQTRLFLALGMSKMQAKVNFCRAEQMPLPPRYLTDKALADRLAEALLMAENGARQLWGAARTLATLLLSPQSDRESGRRPAPEDVTRLMGQWAVERRYWTRLETPFRLMMEGLPGDTEGALAEWRHRLLRTAREALDGLVDSLDVSPRTLKAAVRARGQLAAGLTRVLPAAESL